MFYSTTIKSIGEYGIVDMQGRYLSFIGDLSVKEGDTVFTDGKYIFGHAPPKGSPAIFDEPSGIPVLGDEYSLSTEEQKEELRGYFTNRGKYKRYRVKGDEWIVNAEKTFAHDGSFETVDDTNVIDAEIALDNEGNEDGVYTVEKIIGSWHGEVPDDEFFVSVSEYGERYGETNIDFQIDIANWDRKSRKFESEKEKWLRFIPADKSEFIQKNGEIIKSCELVIKKDSAESARLNFSDFVQASEARAWGFISDFNVIGHTSENVIDTRAILENFKITATGRWEALVLIDVLAKRTFSAENAATYLYVGSPTNLDIQEIPVDQFHTDDPKIMDLVHDYLGGVFDTKKINVETYTYGPARVITYPKTYKSSLCTHHCFLAKISADKLDAETSSWQQEILFETMRYFPLYFLATELHDPAVGYATPIDGFKFSHKIDCKAIERDFELPCEYPEAATPKERYPITWYKYSGSFVGTMTGIYAVWNLGSETISETVNGEYYLAVLIFRLYDSRTWLGVTTLNLISNTGDNRYIDTGYSREDEFSLCVQDDFQAKFATAGDTSWLYDKDSDWQFDCILEKIHDTNNKRAIEDFLSDDTKNAHQWNMSLATLKGGGYLFGIHADPDRHIDGELYKIDGTGKVEQIGDGLKNFRLRELKKMTKAKK